MVNAGGIINIAHEWHADGYSLERALAQTAGIEKTTRRVFELAAEERVTTAHAADELARRRIAAEGTEPYRPGVTVGDRATRYSLDTRDSSGRPRATITPRLTMAIATRLAPRITFIGPAGRDESVVAEDRDRLDRLLDDRHRTEDAEPQWQARRAVGMRAPRRAPRS